MSTENNIRRSRRRGAMNPTADAPVDDSNVDAEETLDEAANTVVASSDEGITNAYTAPKGRATVGRRSRVRVQDVDQGNVVTRRSSSVMDYITGVRDELAKVTWPTREEALRLGRIVVIVTVLAAIVLGLIAFGFTILFREGLRNPIIFVIFFALAAVAAFFLNRALRSDNSEPTYTSRL